MPRRILLAAVLLSFLGVAADAERKKPEVGNGGRVPDPPPVLDVGTPAVISLPGTIDEITPADGGRLLIVQMRKLRQLAVIDVAAAKLLKRIPLPSQDVVVAAGAKKMYVGLQDLRQIEQWDLEKLARDKNTKAPEGGVQALAMGATAQSPLICLGDMHAKRTWMLDPRSLKPEPFAWKNWDPGGAWGPAHVHVSYDGATAVGCGGGWAGIDVAALGSNRVADCDGGGYVNGDTLVSGDGQLLFPHDGGALRSDLVGKITAPPGYPFPAVDTGYCLTLAEADGRPELTLFFTTDIRPVAKLRGLGELHDRSSLPYEQRVQFVPREHRLITVPASGDKLMVREFDLATALAASRIDYLFADSSPPRYVTRTQQYKYAIRVQSSAGNVQYSLEDGPKGMRVDPKGVVHWGVPANLPDRNVAVVIAITDASGRQIFHNFLVGLISANKSKPIDPGETVESGPRRTITPLRIGK